MNTKDHKEAMDQVQVTMDLLIEKICTQAYLLGAKHGDLPDLIETIQKEMHEARNQVDKDKKIN